MTVEAVKIRADDRWMADLLPGLGGRGTSRAGRRSPRLDAPTTATPTSVAPLRVRVLAARPRDHVFDVVTRRIGTWWPVESQCEAPERVVDVRLDPWVGGQVAEVWDDGSEHPFATVLRWRPPGEVDLAWRVRVGAELTDVRVRLAEASWVSTWVTVEQTGWTGLGADGPALRAEYRERWADVLGALLWAV